MTTTTQFAASSATLRATAFGLAALVSLALLGGMGSLANQQHDAAQLAAAPSIPTQVVVISAKRLHA